MFTLTKLELRKPQTECIISDFPIYTTDGKPWPSSTTVLCDTLDESNKVVLPVNSCIEGTGGPCSVCECNTYLL